MSTWKHSNAAPAASRPISVSNLIAWRSEVAEGLTHKVDMSPLGNHGKPEKRARQHPEEDGLTT